MPYCVQHRPIWGHWDAISLGKALQKSLESLVGGGLLPEGERRRKGSEGGRLSPWWQHRCLCMTCVLVKSTDNRVAGPGWDRAPTKQQAGYFWKFSYFKSLSFLIGKAQG